MITPDKILQYIEGNLKWLGDALDLLPEHLREQVIWRSKICKDDCVIYSKCKYCGCSLPGKFYVTESCNNGEKFPDLMSQQDWKEYKNNNNISI